MHCEMVLKVGVNAPPVARYIISSPLLTRDSFRRNRLWTMLEIRVALSFSFRYAATEFSPPMKNGRRIEHAKR